MPSKAILHVDSEVHALEGGISHPVIESLRRRLTLGASFAVRENELLGESFSFVPGVASNRNQATVLRFSQDYIERWEQQALALRSTFGVGLDALGATPERDKNSRRFLMDSPHQGSARGTA